MDGSLLKWVAKGAIHLICSDLFPMQIHTNDPEMSRKMIAAAATFAAVVCLGVCRLGFFP